MDDVGENLNKVTVPTFIMMEEKDYWANNEIGHYYHVETRKVNHKKVLNLYSGIENQMSHYTPLLRGSYEEIEKEMSAFLERLIF